MVETSYPDALPAQYRLHWYVLERVLGQGGFGITYLARDTNLDQPVAIKEYLPVDVATRRADATVRARTDEHGERYRWGLERFIREARTLARFDHPNIVRVLSVFEHNDTAYMVMRFEEGENCAALLERRRTLPEAELLRILLPIVDGLALVHNAGFIHRDIKPDNIHIRADGSPVLLDFGSARLALGQSRTVTILVAPGYAPFEQYYSTGENQGPWTDIYGLGATAYRAIAGIAPLDAIARSKGRLGSTQEILVPAVAIGKGRYSERFLQAIDHALEFAEKDRPQTLAEWRRELSAEAAAAAPAGSSATASNGPAPSVGAASIPAPPASAPTPARPGSRGMLIGLIVGAAVAVTAMVIYTRLGAERENIRKEQERIAQERDTLQKQQDEWKRQAELQKQEEIERRKREDVTRTEAAARVAEPAPQPKVVAEPARKTPQPKPAPAKKVEPERAPPAVTMARPAEVPRSAPPPETVPAPIQKSETAPKPEPKPAPESPPAAKTDSATAREKPSTSELAYRGDPAAQLAMGEMHELGRNAAQNYFQAYYWYSAAQRCGSPGARAKKDQVASRLQPAEVAHAEKLARQLPCLGR